MDRLITILTGLVLGLRGSRRAAMEAVVDDIRKEFSEFEADLIAAREDWKDVSDHLTRLEVERNSAMKDLEEEKERRLALQRKLDIISSSVPRWADGSSWRLMVRRKLLSSHKFHTLKALRTVTTMGLKDAKEWVESRIPGPEVHKNVFESQTGGGDASDWIILSDEVGAADLLIALDVLFNQTHTNRASPPPTLDDVSFRSTFSI